MSGSCYCSVLSGTGLCDLPILRPEEPYRLSCDIVCDLETSRVRRPWPALGCCAKGKKVSSSNPIRQLNCCDLSLSLTHTHTHTHTHSIFCTRRYIVSQTKGYVQACRGAQTHRYVVTHRHRYAEGQTTRGQKPIRKTDPNTNRNAEGQP
jgi:hypothetical protein